MKLTGACPKCRSEEIYRIPGSLWSKADPRIQTGWLRSESTPVTRYLCGQCGYLEEWVSDPSSLQALTLSLAGRWQEEPESNSTPIFTAAAPGTCPACGAAIAEEDSVCPSCGINLAL